MAELFFVIIPSLFILFILFESIFLLYFFLVSELIPLLTIKIEGHQWY